LPEDGQRTVAEAMHCRTVRGMYNCCAHRAITLQKGGCRYGKHQKQNCLYRTQGRGRNVRVWRNAECQNADYAKQRHNDFD